MSVIFKNAEYNFFGGEKVEKNTYPILYFKKINDFCFHDTNQENYSFTNS